MKTTLKSLIMVLVPLISFAQISVNFLEVPADWGMESTYWSLSDTVSGVPVNLGSPGGGNTWDYSYLDSTNQFSQTIVEGDETPYGAQFPDANLVMETEDLSQFGIPGPGYIYFKINPSVLLLEGLGIEYGGQPFPIVFENPVTWLELPLDYGDDWQSGFFYQFFFDSLGFTYRVDIEGTFDAHADAYGDLIIPDGNYDALRVRNDINVDFTLYIILFGIPIEIMNEQVSYISYFWMSEGLDMSALVMSMEGETNPNFTTASSFSVLAELTTGFYTVLCNPVNPPVQIPAGGGSFGFTANLHNNMPDPGNFDVWTGAYLPNGNFYGPILLRNITLPGFGSLVRTLNQSVPASAPAGTYYYVTAIGDIDQGEVQSRGGFSFVKLGDGGDSLADGGWDISDFDGQKEVGENNLPAEFRLLPAYPNPFNTETKLSYILPEDGYISLRVYDIAGRETKVLCEGWETGGLHEMNFDASDLASGVYFAVLQAKGLNEMQKLILIK